MELYELTHSQALRLAELEAQIEALQAQLSKDSRTSGKPPSSDGFKKRPRTQSERGKSGRSVGGQPGHPGQTLERCAEPDRVVEHRPTHCNGCGQCLRQATEVARGARQVFDLPPLSVEVTEHHAVVVSCPQCGEVSGGAFPTGVAQAVQYGPRLKALSVYLKDYQLLPYDRQSELFEDVYGHRLSVASLLKAEVECAAGLQAPLEAIGQQLVAAPVVGFDETGLRVEGQLHWLHTPYPHCACC